MMRLAAAVTLGWTTILAAVNDPSSSTTIDNTTTIDMSLFLAGIAGTAALFWWGASDRQRIVDRLTRLEHAVYDLANSKANATYAPTQRDHNNETKQKGKH